MEQCSMDATCDVIPCEHEFTVEYPESNVSHIKIEHEDEQCTQWAVVQDDEMSVSSMDSITEESGSASDANLNPTQHANRNTAMIQDSSDQNPTQLVEVWKQNCKLSFKCATCDSRFLDKTSGLVHNCEHEDKKPYVCGIRCEETIGNATIQSEKTSEQSGDDTSSDESGTDSQRLEPNDVATGRLGDSVEQPYKCRHCMKLFKVKSSLLRHENTHTGAQTYECDVCPKKFFQAIHLKSHQRTHTGEKPYKCEICTKSFRHSTTRQQHQMTHTGEKPYKCTMCDKRFIRSQHLRRHHLTHTRENPYKCTICAKCFGQSNTLRRHQMIHTGEKPYKCTVCSKSFRRTQHLQSHQKTHATGQEGYK